MRDRFISLLGNPVVFILTALIYVSTLGPFLISAASTFAVLLGLALAVLLMWWLARLPQLMLNRKDIRRNRRGSGSDSKTNFPTTLN